MNYKVGQIIFMSNPKNAQIIPLKIVEEIIKTTEQGKEKEYTVRFPDRSGTEASIKALKGEVFSSIDEIEKFMIQNTTAAIKKMVVAAKELKKQSFPENQAVENLEQTDMKLKQSDVGAENKTYIELSDGTKAKVNFSSLKK